MTLTDLVALAGWAFVAILLLFWKSFLPAYLNKKGENLATHEDIDKLVAQVEAVTKATKKIEASISSEVWDRQKQWELKREILFDATKRLSEIDNELLSLNTFWQMKTGGQVGNEASKITLEHQYVTDWQKAMRSFEEVESLVYVSCSKETMMAFARLGDLMRRTASTIVSGDLEVYKGLQAERDKKLATVRLAIRKELGVKLDVTPPAGASSATTIPGSQGAGEGIR